MHGIVKWDIRVLQVLHSQRCAGPAASAHEVTDTLVREWAASLGAQEITVNPICVSGGKWGENSASAYLFIYLFSDWTPLERSSAEPLCLRTNAKSLPGDRAVCHFKSSNVRDYQVRGRKALAGFCLSKMSRVKLIEWVIETFLLFLAIQQIHLLEYSKQEQFLFFFLKGINKQVTENGSKKQREKSHFPTNNVRSDLNEQSDCQLDMFVCRFVNSHKHTHKPSSEKDMQL